MSVGLTGQILALTLEKVVVVRKANTGKILKQTVVPTTRRALSK